MAVKKTVTKLQEYSESIVNTVREPLFVLHQDRGICQPSIFTIKKQYAESE